MVLHLFDALEVIPPEPFCPDGWIESLDIGGLFRLARLDVDP